MKVLIISHNVLSPFNNMGITLMENFKAFDTQNIAQLYIHSEVPTDKSVCTNYYRFTDTDALKSIIPVHKHGRSFTEQDIETNKGTSRTDSGITGEIYQFGRKRTGFIYFARNMVWKCSHWFTKELKQWLLDFSPDVIFFASGDYAFTYNITYKIAEFLKIPVVVYCCDDFFLFNPNEKSFLGRYVNKNLIKTAKKLFNKALFGTAICDNMANEYEKLFNKKFNVLYTGAENKKLNYKPGADRISYIGNISYDRCVQLADMGKALLKLNRQSEPKMIDVYSGEKDPECLKYMTEENGIRFHGRISKDEVVKVMENSMAVIHTESFNETYMEQIRFSVSTKIAESMMYGPCLIAYGPQGIASMDYLRDNDTAFIMNTKDELESGLAKIINDAELRSEIVSRARKLAESNHDSQNNSNKLKKWMEDALTGR